MKKLLFLSGMLLLAAQNVQAAHKIDFFPEATKSEAERQAALARRDAELIATYGTDTLDGVRITHRNDRFDIVRDLVIKHKDRDLAQVLGIWKNAGGMQRRDVSDLLVLARALGTGRAQASLEDFRVTGILF